MCDLSGQGQERAALLPPVSPLLGHLAAAAPLTAQRSPLATGHHIDVFLGETKGLGSALWGAILGTSRVKEWDTDKLIE